MNYRSISIFLILICAAIQAPLAAEVPQDYISDKSAGEYDDVLECIINIDGICVADYVEEVLDQCKDCEISAPEGIPPSAIEAYLTEQGLALLESALGHPKTAAFVGTIVGITSVIGTIVSVKYLLNKCRTP